MIQFSCRFAFFINFTSFKSDTENSANFDTVSSKRGNFDQKSARMYRLQHSAVYNRVSEQRLDEEQHQQAVDEVRNSRQASGQRQMQCAY